MSNVEKAKGTAGLTAANSLVNAFNYMIKTAIRGQINTAEAVLVVGVEAGGPQSPSGYVDVKPLVCQTDADGNTLPPSTIYRLPYARLQGGRAALVIDPVPGDIGLAVFAKRDSSNLRQAKTEPVRPGSFRVFDQADGFYMGGFLNKAPEIWLELNQENRAVLHAPVCVTVETAECVIDSPLTRLTGDMLIEGNVTWAGTGQGKGGPAVFRGGIDNSGGKVTSNNVTLETHTHSGVQTGNGNTGRPNG